jgi:hypothetical protein
MITINLATYENNNFVKFFDVKKFVESLENTSYASLQINILEDSNFLNEARASKSLAITQKYSISINEEINAQNRHISFDYHSDIEDKDHKYINLVDLKKLLKFTLSYMIKNQNCIDIRYN